MRSGRRVNPKGISGPKLGIVVVNGVPKLVPQAGDRLALPLPKILRIWGLTERDMVRIGGW